MALVQTQHGDVWACEEIRTGLRGKAQIRVHLYVSDTDPWETVTADDFDEPAYPGYVPQVIRHWTPAHLVGNLARTEADPVQFAPTVALGAPLIIRGYYVIRVNRDPQIWWAEKFSEPVELQFPTKPLVLWLTYTNDRIPPP